MIAPNAGDLLVINDAKTPNGLIVQNIGVKPFFTLAPAATGPPHSLHTPSALALESTVAELEIQSIHYLAPRQDARREQCVYGLE